MSPASNRAALFAFGGAAVAAALFLAPSFYHAWAVDPLGLSTITRKPPTWDFTNLWMGGRLALASSIDAVFEPQAFRAAMRSVFSPQVQQSEWSYPPTLLLVAAPLGLLPLTLAYALFTAGGLIALTRVCRLGGMPPFGCLLVAVSPTVLINVLYGQNGAWTAAFLLGGLMWSDRKPVLAGALISLLSMKPHLGALVPLCLIAAGHWRAFGWSCVFSLALAALSAVLFGVEAWRLFFAETRPLMQGILEAPWGTEDYQLTAITVFHLTRALGGGIGGAYACQAVAAVCAAAVAWRLWRRPGVDPFLRAVITALLTLLASPYGWTYDLVALPIALLLLRARSGAHPAALALAYGFPALNKRLTYYLLPVAPVILAATVYACLRQTRKNEPVTGGREERPLAA